MRSLAKSGFRYGGWGGLAVALIAVTADGQTDVRRGRSHLLGAGDVTLTFDGRALHDLGLEVFFRGTDVVDERAPRATLRLDTSASVIETADLYGAFRGVSRATFRSRGAVLIGHAGRSTVVMNPTVRSDGEGNWWITTARQDPQGERIVFRISDTIIDLAIDGGRPEPRPSPVRLAGSLELSESLARDLGVGSIAGAWVGTITIDAELAPVSATGALEQRHFVGVSAEGALAGGGSGPDVIVGELPNVRSYGSVDGIAAFSVGTTSCNIGDVPLNWVATTSQHPVIGQNLYRLKDDRFEQIGQSWLKHGFLALALNQCDLGCNNPGTGTLLGVGCSDPYSASLNGSRGGLGPKSEVNAFTGGFPFPPRLDPPIENLATRRIQVTHADLDPAQDGGGFYFVEGQYVTPDDAAAGNQNNNSAYRPVDVSFNASDERWELRLTGTTQRQRSAIRAWRDTDSSVVETDVLVPGGGLFVLAAKAVDLGSGLWRYEYAIQNLTSDRSVGSFSVPMATGTVVSGIGFHDIDYHSGEVFDGTDWAVAATDLRITWSTEDHSVNPEANALRWGTLYNFWFVADASPQTTLVTCGLFKPGTPAAMDVITVGPEVDADDCNANGAPDACDVDCNLESCLDSGWTGPCGGSDDCNDNQSPDECDIIQGGEDCNANSTPDECDLASGTSGDCDGNMIPDECEEPDCNDNGRPDGCDIADGTSGDCNGNGIPDECEEPDCNENGRPDSCDLADGTSEDCNGNGIPDECGEPDCLSAATIGGCDLMTGPFQDCDGDGLLDACVPPVDPPRAEPDAVPKNRYLSFAGTNPGEETAIRVMFVDLPPPNDALNGTAMWVALPHDTSELGGLDDDTPPTFSVATLGCEPVLADWTSYGTVHVYHAGLVPGGTYALQAMPSGCFADSEPSYSVALSMRLARWGDVAGRLEVGEWTNPDETVDITIDVLALLAKFSNRPGAPAKARADLEPATPDQKINISDIVRALDAFRGLPFPFIAAEPCGEG